MSIAMRRILSMAYGDALASDVRLEGEIPVMSSGGVTGAHHEANTLSPAIVVGRKGSFGSVHWTNDPAFVIDTAFFIDARHTRTDLRWLFYVLQSLELSSTSSDVGIPGLSREGLYQRTINTLPPLEEQRRIADFLDDQVGRIDSLLIFRGERVALLKERKQASITAHVTGTAGWTNLHREEHRNRKEDSGTTRRTIAMSRPPWLASMSADWPVVHPKQIFSERRHHANDSDTHLTPSQSHGVLPQTEYMKLTGKRVVLNLTGQDNMKRVEANDFIIHLRSFQGGIEYSALPGKVSSAYTVLKPKNGIEPLFFKWVLKSAGYIQELNSSTNQLRDGQSIKFADFASIDLPLPPIEEQRRIADFLDDLEKSFGLRVNLEDQGIRLLTERKRALITAAVTGKMDVTTAQPIKVGAA